jgi:ribosomal protein S2
MDYRIQYIYELDKLKVPYVSIVTGNTVHVYLVVPINDKEGVGVYMYSRIINDAN